MEPGTYENPQLLDVLKKEEKKEEEKKEEVSEGPVETAPAAVPAVVETKLAVASSDCKVEEKTEVAEKQEKAAAQPEVETPSKRRRRLPRVADYLGQVPGQRPSQSGAAAPVDPKDF